MSTILVVDERADSRRFLMTLLGYMGHRLLEATSGAAALELVRSDHPDLVITDIVMSAMEGTDLIHRLRTEPLSAGIPLIFYTATDRETEARAIARSCGVSAVLTRSSDPEVILTAVSEALNPGLPPSLADAQLPSNASGSVEHERLGLLSERLTGRLADQLHMEVADRRRAEASSLDNQNRLSGIVNSAMDAIITIDEAQCIQLFNPAAEEMFGYSAAEMLGQPVERLIPERFRARHQRHVEHFAQSGMINRKMGASEFTGAVTANGDEFPVEASISQIDLQGERLFTVILRDISERRRSEEALRSAHDELEMRVAERTAQLAMANAELQAAKAEADRANLAKSDFLSRMSHELRTPLNAILGFGQILGMEQLAPRQREGVDHILNAGWHLLELINEVLDIARVEAGRIDLSIAPVAVSTVLRESMDLIRPLAAQHNIHIETDEAALSHRDVLADHQRLKQVVINLLSNAVKYNREEGTVNISCRELLAGRLRIQVSDSGAGIAANELTRLFIPFERLSAAAEIEGTGLGLALSKRLVEAMNGTLGVESVPGQGSTFYVELPLAEAPLD